MKTLIKYTLLLLASLSVPIEVNADNGSLTIIHEDYDKAKIAAAKEHKLLLIDFYTTWCGPCKIMSRDLFDNEESAEAVGKNFVVLKYNAEADTVFDLAKKYHVNSYPTSLILSPDARVITKKTGIKIDGTSMDVDSYMEFLHDAVRMQQKGKYIPGVSTDIALDFPQFYIDRFNRVKKDYSSFKEEYWKATPLAECEKEVPFCVLSVFGGTPQVDSYFLANRNSFRKLYGEVDVNTITYSIVSYAFHNAIETLDESEFEKCCKDAVKYLQEKDAEFVTNYYSIQFWKKQGNWMKIVDYASNNKTELNGSGEMNSICWDIFEHCDDLEVIKKAALLMKEYNDKKASWATLDTYANLLYKSGDTQMAIEQMEYAIKSGLKEGEDVSESEQALKKFKAEAH